MITKILIFWWYQYNSVMWNRSTIAHNWKSAFSICLFCDRNVCQGVKLNVLY